MEDDLSRPTLPLRRRLAFALVGTVLGIALLEVGLRLAWPIARTATLPEGVIREHVRSGGLVYDPDLLWTRPPPHESSDRSINAQGFRQRTSTPEAKTPGVKRAIAFGDSQTMGAGVDDPETWPAVAGAALPDWEVLNAGISGYKSLQVYRLLRLRMARFSPDAVVVDCWPFDSPRDDGPLVGTPTEGWRAQVGAWWFGSRLVRLLKLATERLRPARRGMSEAASRLGRGDAGEGNHALIQRWADAQGIAAVFVTYPIYDRRAGRVGCLTAPGELPAGGLVVDACSALQNAKMPAHALFLDRNHLTVEGNRVVGEAVAKVLAEL